MKIAIMLRRYLRGILEKILRRYNYQIVKKDDLPRSFSPSNIVQDGLIICNFCGTVYKRSGPNHSEFLNCPYCDSIARERVAYQCILDELSNRTGSTHSFINTAAVLDSYKLLECSPRHNTTRKLLYQSTLDEYISSDFDMSSHRSDLQLDLTSDNDVKPHTGKFDIIICSHVLEHIPEYKKALSNLHLMLSEGGFLILQVPLLESRYTPVTWDEFHADNTRVYHHFGFDLVNDLEEIYSEVQPTVGLLDFQITSPEIKPDKYKYLQTIPEKCKIFGKDVINIYGLGIPDLCDAFIARK